MTELELDPGSASKPFPKDCQDLTPIARQVMGGCSYGHEIVNSI
jgi:hypothetical protein